MFEEFRRAWRQAVDNFWLELGGPGGARGDRTKGAYREVARARTQLERLDADIGDCRHALDGEREQLAACERRQRMAADIDDRETARVAAEYGRRHRERVEVLALKLEALEAERRLCRRDLAEMERALNSGRVGVPGEELEELDRHPAEAEFRTLEDSARDRAAQDRLDEIKRRMGG